MIIENDNTNQSRYSVERRARFMPQSTTMGKLPPQARDLEEAVLGALMLERDALFSVSDILKPELFYVEAHQKIYQAIKGLLDDNSPVDILTVTAQLRTNGELEMVGGAYYITELTNRVASAANIEFHSRIIQQKYLQRELIRISIGITTNAFEDTTDVLELMDNIQMELFSLQDINYSRDIKTFDNLVKDNIEDLRKPSANGLTGVPCGYIALDRITAGWQKSDLTIIAARPAMGKTAFVINCARNAAVDFNTPVAVFSLEMSADQLTKRLLSSESTIELASIIKKRLSLDEVDQLAKDTIKLEKAPIIIDDTPALTITQFRSKAIRMKKLYNIQLIIIDYLQLMQGKSEGKFGGNREQEISSISRALKMVAKELDIPVIALSQLSRAVESRPGSKKPMLSDLRESGSIEQDADNVFFIYRPEYYGFEYDDDNQPTTGQMQLIIAKHRNGMLDTVKVKFFGKYMRIGDWEDMAPVNTAAPAGFTIVPASQSNLDFSKGSNDDAPF